MAVLSADKQRNIKAIHGPLRFDVIPLAGYTNFGGGDTEHTVYKGSAVMIDVSDTDGYGRACPLFSGDAAQAGDIFCGIAMEQKKVTSSDLADGAVKVGVLRNGLVPFAKGSLAVTDIGAAAYLTDDDNISTTSTNNLWCGYIEDVDDTYAWVNIAPAFKMANSAT